MKTTNKFFITTSIPYLNAAPHLGHSLEYVESDVIARYQRMIGNDVFFLTGADEHGAKIVRSAQKAEKSPRQFVDTQVKIYQKLLNALNISNDDFIRTSDEIRHWQGACVLWKKLYDAGDIYKGTYRGLYCVGHEAFITEKDLQNGACIDHKTIPEQIEEDNYLFRLSKYTLPIRKAIEKGDIAIIPETRKNETLKMLDEAEDISFSRPSKDIAWGVPVPGDSTQTMYVWCDALSNYITAIGYGRDNDNFGKWWPADAQIIGKDILRFHSVIWLAMLMSAKLALPKTIFVHGWIHVEGEKMSKTIGNVVEPLQLINKYGADAVRFYLIHEISTLGDSDYSEECFVKAHEGLLVKGVGNLLSRTATMVNNFDFVSKPSLDALVRFPFKTNLGELVTNTEKASLESMAPAFWVDDVLEPAYHSAMASYSLNEAIKKLWTLFHMLDQYIEEYKVYKIVKEKPEDAKVMLWHL
ncbi:MAG: methionine--tRNA ligase, partial [Patescibacteria group bacterium]